MSKVVDTFRRPSVLIETPVYQMSAARRVSTLIPQFPLYLCIEVSKTACNGTIVHILRL